MNFDIYISGLNEVIRQFFFSKSDYDFVNFFTDISREKYKSFRDDLYNDKLFINSIEKHYYRIRKKRLSLLKYEEWNKLIYYLVRNIEPEIIIETGVFDGTTTSFFLKALKENGKGHLYSIDLPAYETIEGSTHRMKFTKLPTGLEPGWLIPQELKDRWTLQKGPTSSLLKPLLEKLGRVDFFLHDSLHTYTNMIYEYDTVWPYLPSGGILASDDILWNPSFNDFSKRKKRDYIGKYRFGVLKK